MASESTEKHWYMRVNQDRHLETITLCNKLATETILSHADSLLHSNLQPTNPRLTEAGPRLPFSRICGPRRQDRLAQGLRSRWMQWRRALKKWEGKFYSCSLGKYLWSSAAQLLKVKNPSIHSRLSPNDVSPCIKYFNQNVNESNISLLGCCKCKRAVWFSPPLNKHRTFVSNSNCTNFLATVLTPEAFKKEIILM